MKKDNQEENPDNQIQIDKLYNDVRKIIDSARNNAIRSVDFCRVQMYWLMGQRIFEEEQQGKTRAAYGSFLLQNLAKRLEPEFGSGFGYRQLKFCRQFYRTYPNRNTLRSQLNWSQYRMLIQIPDPEKREYYEIESVNNAWSARETERQINAMLYERLLVNNDKEKMLAIARKERIPDDPTEIIKAPMVLEFLGLHRESSYYEKDLESAIITHLTEFLLEMGKGFSFVARQKRLLLEDNEFFIDLVLYNRLLRCHVIIELKTGKLTHQDLGQLQMYVNYFDRYEKLPDENSTIGILLCTAKNDTVVRMTLPADNKNILAHEYQLYLPTTEQLIEEVSEVKKMTLKKNNPPFYR